MDPRIQALYLLAKARNYRLPHYELLVGQLGSLEALLECSAEQVQQLQLPAGLKHRLAEVRQCSEPAAELAELKNRGISAVGWGDEEYPELLAQIPDAPLVLFCIGEVQQMRHHGIAIVGSRKCSQRGKELAYEFGRELAEIGVPVVSGMALGIDGAGHEGALAAGGPSVAVLGCGVDVIYPPAHRELYARLCAEALVLSEYPPGVSPLKEHFPQRNRIISGLARGTVVVEAPLGSGALITAKLAAEQGRDVFAVPGPVSSPSARGTHHLIKHGQAKLVENVDDILVEFGTTRAALRAERQAGAMQDQDEEMGVMGSSDAENPQLAARLVAKRGVTPEEQALLDALSYEGTHVNELVRKLGMTTPECIARLTMLEVKGLISAAGSGYYVRL